MPNLDLKTRMAVQQSYLMLREFLLVAAERGQDWNEFDALDVALNTLGQLAGADVRPIAVSPVDGKVKI